MRPARPQAVPSRRSAIACRLLAALFIAGGLAAAEPAWADAADASAVPGYPADRWLVGLGQETLASADPATAEKRAVEQARAEVARSIRARVVASASHDTTSEQRSGAGERFAERFAQTSTITSDVELTGLRTEVCRRADRVLALAAVERGPLLDGYRAQAARLRVEAEAKAAAARGFEAGQRLAEARDAWAAVAAPVTTAGELLGLVQTLGGTVSPPETESQAALHREAATALARLEARPLDTVDDLADALARRLHAQVPAVPPILVTPLTVRGTRIPSPFGRAAAARLSAALGRTAWQVVTADQAQGGTARERAKASGAQAVLLGSVWPQPGGDCQVMVEAIALANGARLAVAEARFPAAGVARSGEPLEPENAAQALATQQTFANGEVVSQGLTVEVWTNKGDDAQLFTDGEEMRVFVRADRPCHLRLIYHLATGEQVLLLDDRFIDEAKVNRVYELPETFVCAAPFGAETLQANASTVPFPVLTTVSKDGYAIIREDLAGQLAKTRGMKAKAQERPLQAETRVVLTTVPRGR